MEESDDEIEFQGYGDGRFGIAWIGPAGAVQFRVAMTREDAAELSRRFAYALELATKGPKWPG